MCLLGQTFKMLRIEHIKAINAVFKGACWIQNQYQEKRMVFLYASNKKIKWPHTDRYLIHGRGLLPGGGKEDHLSNKGSQDNRVKKEKMKWDF